MNLRTTLALLALLAPVARQGEEAEARTLLDRALAEVAKGRYSAALKQYEKLAREHPGTAAGRVAERRTRPNALLGWADLVRTGPSENRVDVVIAGDGYTREHLATFDKQAADVPEVFERNEVLGEYLHHFNFIRVAVVSAEAGVDEFNRKFDTAFDARDSGKLGGDVDLDRDRARALLGEVPGYEGLAIVLVNAGRRGTGREGIAAVAERAPFALARAWGGAFAGLGDELELDQGVYIPIEPAPNISATEDPASVPWRHWLEADAPGVGVYPGALGRVDGVWKPVADGCAMADTGIFCTVCREAVVLAIYRSCDPIESALPDVPEDTELQAERRMEFEVTVLRPRSNALEVHWWVLPERGLPNAPAPRAASAEASDRRSRGPLRPVGVDPAEVGKVDRKGRSSFRLDATALEPGRYRVLCRVRDTTRTKRSKLPWVLSDPDGLLESERGWWVTVE